MNKSSAHEYRSSRSGFTLIEIMTTLSVLLVIALAAASMLGTVTRIGLKNQDRNQVRADVARLAAKFRADVRAADAVDVDDQTRSLELKFGDEVVRYRINLDSLSIVREQTEGQPFQRDGFRISESCHPEFEIQDRDVTLRLTAEDARIPWIIQAVRP